MSKIFVPALVTSLFLVLGVPSIAQELQDPSFQKLDEVFAQKGKSQPENVKKYTWPRKDLQVKVSRGEPPDWIGLQLMGGFQKDGRREADDDGRSCPLAGRGESRDR